MWFPFPATLVLVLSGFLGVLSNVFILYIDFELFYPYWITFTGRNYSYNLPVAWTGTVCGNLNERFFVAVICFAETPKHLSPSCV